MQPGAGFRIKLPDGTPGQLVQIISAAAGRISAVETDAAGQADVPAGSLEPGVYYVGVPGRAKCKIAIVR